jgi:hypothetical protein
MPLPVLALFAVLALQSATPIPSPSPVPAGTSRITGRVVIEGDTPLEGVAVELVAQGQRAALQTATDADGRYSFDNIAFERYIVTAKRSGYLMGMKGRGAGGISMTALMLGGIPASTSATRHSQEVDFIMIRGAVISGRVTDANGDVVPGTRVGASSGVVSPGRLHQTTVNAGGDFEITVEPGDVVVSASAPARDDGTEYLQTFYPGVQARTDAAAIRLSAGDRTAGVNLVLLKDHTQTVRGGVIGAGGTPVTVDLSYASSGTTVRSMRATDDGRFAFTRVDSGHYVVTARTTTHEGTAAAWQALTVDGPLQHVDLYLEPTGTLRGRIVADSGDLPTLAGVRVGAALTATTNDVEPILSLQAAVAADGTFSIDGVYGPRTLRVIGLPAGLSVTRVLVGGADANAPHVIVQPGVTIENVTILVSRQ